MRWRFIGSGAAAGIGDARGRVRGERRIDRRACATGGGQRRDRPAPVGAGAVERREHRGHPAGEAVEVVAALEHRDDAAAGDARSAAARSRCAIAANPACVTRMPASGSCSNASKPAEIEHEVRLERASAGRNT